MKISDISERSEFCRKLSPLQSCCKNIKDFFAKLGRLISGSQPPPAYEKLTEPREIPDTKTASPASAEQAVDAGKKWFSIRNREDWNKLIANLKRLDKIEQVIESYGELGPFGVTLANIRKRIDKFEKSCCPAEFDEETTENIVPNLGKCLNRFNGMLEACGARSSKLCYRLLEKGINDYMENIGGIRLNFQPGALSQGWLDLEHAEFVPLPTEDVKKIGIIYTVMVQPQILRYRDRDGEEQRYCFCGKCAIFSEKQNA